MTDTPVINFTVQFALRAHKDQRYGDYLHPDGSIGESYSTHVLDVARRLQVYGRDAVLAGLLHDTVEDTYVTLETLEGLGYPRQVIEAVDAVTRRPGEDYEQMIRRAAAHPLGCLVKLADNRSNFERLGFVEDRAWANRSARKYTRALAVLLKPYYGLMADADAAGTGWPQFGPPVGRDERW
jgi:(p)ppGpp synthase/HD superfamily hydrolase